VRLLLSGLLALLVAAPASAEEVASLEHTGSVGLFVAVGPEWATTEVAPCLTCRSDKVAAGFGALLDLGGTIAVGSEGSELAAKLRLVRLAGEGNGEAALVGDRRYFGRDELKSFFSFDAQLFWRPTVVGGARAGIGGMWDFSPLFGLWLETGASFGLGQGRRFGVELGLGLQGRSYLL